MIECQTCTSWLDTIARLRAGLRTVATEEAVWSGACVQTRLLARPVRLSWMSRAAWLTGAMLLIALPLVLLILEWKSTRRDLAQVKQTALEWQRKYEEKAQQAKLSGHASSQFQLRFVQAR
jgi:predicted anti-sigma-YlaC factor YlaD